MARRYLKMAFTGLVALIGLLAFVNNLLNLEGAHGALSTVVAMGEQPYYRAWGPALAAPWAAWLALAIVMAGELATGLLGLKGLADMIRARAVPALVFEDAKTFAILGAGVGTLVWFGLFITVGELYFNMWQTSIGVGSAEGALRYGAVCAVALIFLGFREEDR